jgi:hypothetical protein
MALSNPSVAKPFLRSVIATAVTNWEAAPIQIGITAGPSVHHRQAFRALEAIAHTVGRLELRRLKASLTFGAAKNYLRRQNACRHNR